MLIESTTKRYYAEEQICYWPLPTEMADANQYKYIRDLLHGDNDFSESKLKTIIHHFPGGDVETRVESEGNFVANDIKRVSHSVAMVGGKTYKL